MKPCPHCRGDIAIRNPSGFCDHLFWPDNCRTCQRHADDAEPTREAGPPLSRAVVGLLLFLLGLGVGLLLPVLLPPFLLAPLSTP